MFSPLSLRWLMRFSAWVILSSVSLAHATNDTPISCPSYAVSQYSCGLCFDGGSIYEGRGAALYDIAINNGSTYNVYYKDETSARVFNTFWGGIVTANVPSFQYNTAFFANCGGSWCATASGRQYTFLKNGEQATWINTQPNLALWVADVNTSLINNSNRSDIRDRNFTVVYSLTANYFVPGSGFNGNKNTLVECSIIWARACGDGVVDSWFEECDLGTQNGSAGATCSSTCNNVPPPPPTDFDLSIQKLVNTSDSDTDPQAVVLRPSDVATYTFVVTNNGPATVNNTTTVTDTTFPVGLTLQGIPSGPGWTCATAASTVWNGNNGFSCTTNAVVSPGSSFSTITVQALVWAVADGSYLRNIATVSNPRDTNPNNNTDPAVIRVSNPTPPPTPTCTSLSPSTSSSGSGSLTVNYTCQGANLPANSTYSINCGNGQTVNAANGTCTYLPGSFSAQCTINGNVTSQSCTASVLVTPAPTPACEGLDVSPVTGWAPLSSSVQCRGSNLPANSTYSINCGNGQTVNTQNGTCTYATAGTFTPRCTINGNLTSAACQGTVTVTSVPPAGFQLALKKFVNTGAGNNDAQTAASGSTAVKWTNFTYTIQVQNLGPAAVAGTTTVSDPIPTGVNIVGTPTGSGWTCSVAANLVNCITSATPTAWVRFADITITAVIPTTSPDGNYLNVATVSNPNEINSPADNTDPAHVNVGSSPVGPSCTSLTASPSSSSNGSLTSILTCQWGNLPANSTYSINCGNGTVLSTQSGSCTFGVGTFTPTCTINGNVTSAACQTSVSVTNGGGGCTNCGGGGTPRCLDIRFGGVPSSVNSIQVGANSNVDVICEWQYSQWAQVNCGNGTVATAITDTRYTGIVGGSAFTAQCRYTAASNYSISCQTSPASSSSIDPACSGLTAVVTGGGGGGGCTNCGGGGTFCGNGRIESGEECDPGTPGSSSLTCSASCRRLGIITNPGNNYPMVPFILSRTPAGATSGTPDGGFSQTLTHSGYTQPGQNAINLFNARLIVGIDTSVFTPNDKITFVPPRSVTATTPLIMRGSTLKCVGPKAVPNATAIISGVERCTPIDTTIGANRRMYVFPRNATIQIPEYTTVQGERVYIGSRSCTGVSQCSAMDPDYDYVFVDTLDLFAGSELAGFLGKNVIPVNQDYADTNYLRYNANNTTNVYVRTPVGNHPRFSVTLQYLEQPIAIRVSKPSVSNAAGGNVSIGGTTSAANIASVAANFLPIVANNFNTAASGLSSATKSNATSATGSISIEKLIPTGVGSSGNPVISQSSDFESTLGKLRGRSDVYVHNGNLTIGQVSTTPSLITLSGVKTVIIKGNLTINSDIRNDAKSSWAFIVSGGNITISKDVKQIAGVYVAIGTTPNGTIKSSGTTIKQLVVDGTLYGNANDLISKRTYVYANNWSRAISVGTVVNYSNRALVSPPPFLTNVLSQYRFDRK